MNIIVPMAGRGSRLRPHTLTTPKPLVKVGGKPIVQRLVEDIAKISTEKIDEIAFIIGDFGKQVETDLLDIASSLGATGKIYHQTEPLGTAHAVHCAKESLHGPVIIAFADTLFRANFTIDPKSIRKKITKRTKAIMPVHLYGYAAFLDEIGEIARKNNLAIVEDAAQSLGTTLNKRHTGTFFDLGCYSFYPGKVITSGEGGIVSTNSKQLYDKLLMIRNHGMIKGYDSKIFGLNLRLPEISAAIAKVQIKRLAKFIDIRRKNANLLSSLLSDLDIQIPTERKGESRNWSLYTITARKRDAMLNKLHSKGIGAATYYPVPIHRIPIYKTNSSLPNTDWATKNVLSLPVHPKVSLTNIKFIGKALREIVNG